MTVNEIQNRWGIVRDAIVERFKFNKDGSPVVFKRYSSHEAAAKAYKAALADAARNGEPTGEKKPGSAHTLAKTVSKKKALQKENEALKDEILALKARHAEDMKDLGDELTDVETNRHHWRAQAEKNGQALQQAQADLASAEKALEEECALRDKMVYPPTEADIIFWLASKDCPYRGAMKKLGITEVQMAEYANETADDLIWVVPSN